MALKIDAEVEEKLTSAFKEFDMRNLAKKNDMRNLANFHRLKNSDFILESKMTEIKVKS